MNCKPVDLHIFDKKKHLTKKEIAEKKAVEVRLGSPKLKIPKELKKNKNAVKKWKFVTGLYDDAGLNIVTDADIEILIRYCLLYDEYLKLVENRDEYKTDIDGTVKYINALTKVGDKMLRHEDLLYLTPASRAKGNSDQKKDKVEDPLEKFGNV